MFTLKGTGSEGSGPGIVRISGSFTTTSTGAVIASVTTSSITPGTPQTGVRPNKGDFTVTRLATGVYLLTYSQATVSVISAGSQFGAAAAMSGTAFDVNPPGFTMVSQDYMVANAANTQYLTDTTNKNLILLCFSAPTSGALKDVYSFGNTGGVANYRVSFDISLATTAMNQ